MAFHHSKDVMPVKIHPYLHHRLDIFNHLLPCSSLPEVVSCGLNILLFFHMQMLHRGGPFINSLLHLEELGFRSSSPAIKKIAFIAWKSLIDNFALNPGKHVKDAFTYLSVIYVLTRIMF